MFQTFVPLLLLVFGFCLAFVTLSLLLAWNIRLNVDTGASANVHFFLPEVSWVFYALITAFIFTALVVDHEAQGSTTAEVHPGQRYPDWTRFGGVAHHLLVSGPVADAASLERLGRRWKGLVGVLHDPDVDPARAGIPTGGLALIRPDGHIGFRSPNTDTEALAALDYHLSSYLTPRPVEGASRPRVRE